MNTFVSILRGINVSGKRMIKMPELKSMYESMDFNNVRTYVQSGNVIFDTVLNDIKELDKKLERKIEEVFGHDVPVIILNKKDLEKAIRKNPFIEKKDVEIERLYITFLAEKPTSENIEKTASYSFPPDEFIIKDKLVYLHCPISYGNSKLNNNFFENKLKVVATTRNWKTVNELYKLMG